MSSNSAKYVLSQAMIDGLRPDLQYQIALTNLLSKNQPTEVIRRLGDNVIHESFEPNPTENHENKPEETTQEQTTKPTTQEPTNTTTESTTKNKPETSTNTPQQESQQSKPNENNEQSKDETKNKDHTCSSKIIIVIFIVIMVMFLFMFYVSYQQRKMYKLFKKLVKEIC
jgi:cobalamin biosynthesis Mg chelatase CobN